MSSLLRPPDLGDEPSAFAPILVANLLPLVGVLWLEWEPATLVLVYGLEVAVSLLVAGGKALFAQRPPPADRDGVVSVSEARLTDKRGRVRVHESLPPIYPRNVPFALSVVLALVFFSGFFGGVVVAAFEPAGPTSPEVGLSVLALVVGQLAETKRRYFGEREYERVSPYAVVETPARQLFALLYLLVWVGGLLGSTGALAVAVCVKLLVEWSTFRAGREDRESNRFVDRLVGWFAGPSDAEAAGSPDPVRAPECDPEARVRPERTAVVLEGLLVGVWRLSFSLVIGGVVLLGAVIAVAAWVDSALVFWLGVAVLVVALLVAVAIQAAKHYLEYGTLEYQRRGDSLVAYDRLLEAPQWAESVYRLRNVDLERARLVDRLLGTRTIRVTTGVRSTATERRLGPVAEPDRLVDAFELPVATTDLEPVNRPLAAAAVLLAVGIVCTGPLLIVDPTVSAGAGLNVVFLTPMLLLVPWKLWQRACSGDG